LRQTLNIIYNILIAFIAAILTLTIAFYHPSSSNTVTTNDKLLISGLFISSCIFGLSVAIRPGWFRRLIKHGNQESKEKKSKKTKLNFKGHHPDCKGFRSHRVVIKSKTLCAGCLGLSIGSILSILLIIFYNFLNIKQSSTILFIPLIIGLIIIFLSYVEITLPIRNSIVHVVSNIFLVFSFLILTVSIFEITGNKIYGVLMIILSFLWLDTRIHLSNWQHNRICKNCPKTCKSY